MSEMQKLIERIRSTPDCSVSPPNGLPRLPGGLELPPDLQEFYQLAGGASLFGDKLGGARARIVAPQEFVPVAEAIMGEPITSGPFPWWFAVADVQDGNYIAIDLNPAHQGLCYDAFHETFTEPGYVAVVASSFSDLLERLLNHGNESTYWLQDDFVALGEAFELYGYKSEE
jgi:hypothetical protein